MEQAGWFGWHVAFHSLRWALKKCLIVEEYFSLTSLRWEEKARLTCYPITCYLQNNNSAHLFLLSFLCLSFCSFPYFISQDWLIRCFAYHTAFFHLPLLSVKNIETHVIYLLPIYGTSAVLWAFSSPSHLKAPDWVGS